ncbi:unnamed protein product [Pleuronectes platessa]|uniref:Uncharacterized protein n=1 Tax=Pleuronectes platessa TaxID=8262 RepID=A0A9N7TZX8_PLEPL|nr:unnamed protein product [Pleuronectes platessa]
MRSRLTDPSRSSQPWATLILPAAPHLRWAVLTRERARSLPDLSGGMSGTPPEVSHREGILLDGTMNRKFSPPTEPARPFDVRARSALPGPEEKLKAEGRKSRAKGTTNYNSLSSLWDSAGSVPVAV